MGIGLALGVVTGIAQTSQQGVPAQPGTADHPPRPAMPVRDPHTAGYVAAKELPDGTLPTPNVDGDFIIGPTHNAAPEMSVVEGVKTTIPLHLKILSDPDFLAGRLSTGFMERFMPRDKAEKKNLAEAV